MSRGDRPIWLVGFMGVGKSAIGARLARRLGRPFVDLDRMIEERSGKSIPEIFETTGEAGFRALERAALEAAAGRGAVVVATGGGAPVDARNRDLMRRTGPRIGLAASVEAIRARVERGGRRPLLEGADDPEAAIRSLLEKRADAYADVDATFDTSERPAAEIVDEMVEWLVRRVENREP